MEPRRCQSQHHMPTPPTSTVPATPALETKRNAAAVDVAAAVVVAAAAAVVVAAAAALLFALGTAGAMPVVKLCHECVPRLRINTLRRRSRRPGQVRESSRTHSADLGSVATSAFASATRGSAISPSLPAARMRMYPTCAAGDAASTSSARAFTPSAATAAVAGVSNAASASTRASRIETAAQRPPGCAPASLRHNRTHLSHRRQRRRNVDGVGASYRSNRPFAPTSPPEFVPSLLLQLVRCSASGHQRRRRHTILELVAIGQTDFVELIPAAAAAAAVVAAAAIGDARFQKPPSAARQEFGCSSSATHQPRAYGSFSSTSAAAAVVTAAAAAAAAPPPPPPPSRHRASEAVPLSAEVPCRACKRELDHSAQSSISSPTCACCCRHAEIEPLRGQRRHKRRRRLRELLRSVLSEHACHFRGSTPRASSSDTPAATSSAVTGCICGAAASATPSATAGHRRWRPGGRSGQDGPPLAQT